MSGIICNCINFIINVLISVPLIFAVATCAQSKEEQIAKWEADIQAFERRDSMEDYDDQAILFVGSSSIRLWDNIEEDMAPYDVIRRGYGGASFMDLAHYIERIAYPHEFSALVVFAGNDIWGQPDDRSPDEIQEYLEDILGKVWKKYPNKPVFVIEITHVPVRKHLIEEMDAANKALENVCSKYSNVYWVPTRDIYLNQQGSIKYSLFREDSIHQNDLGYSLWTSRIKSHLHQNLTEN